MENTPSTRTFWQDRTTQTIVAALIVFILLCLGAFELGYRVAPGVTIERIGTLSVTDTPKGTSVYVDGQLSRTTENTNPINIELIPGTHTIIVSAPNDYPWSGNVTVTSGKKTDVSPILVNTMISGKALTGTEKTAALAAIASSTLPTESSPLTLSNGCATIYVANNQVIESPATTTPSCTPPPYLCVKGSCKPTIIFAPLAPLDEVFPYPGRQDAIVILLDHSLYALGLNPQTPQFFVPIAHGQHPSAGMLSNGTIVISDGGAVSSVSF